MSTSDRRIPPGKGEDWIYRRIEDIENRLDQSETRVNPTIPIYDFLTQPNESIEAQIAIFLNSPESDLRTVFRYPDFSSVAGLNVLGVASVVSSKMRLVPNTGGVGAIWKRPKVRLDLPWQADFDFQITGGSGVNAGHDSHGPGGDGFTFIVQNAGDSEIHGGGQDIGYAGISNALVFEFDMYDDFTYGDISDNELAIHGNGSGAVGSGGAYALANLALVSPNMKDGSIHNARVSYDGTAVHIYVDNNSTPKLSHTVDLGTYLSLDEGKGYVGFTASVGGSVQNSDIINWSFSGTVVAHLGYFIDGVWYLVPTLSM